MGKSLVIKGVDFSANKISNVSANRSRLQNLQILRGVQFEWFLKTGIPLKNIGQRTTMLIPASQAKNDWIFIWEGKTYSPVEVPPTATGIRWRATTPNSNFKITVNLLNGTVQNTADTGGWKTFLQSTNWVEVRFPKGFYGEGWKWIKILIDMGSAAANTEENINDNSLEIEWI